MALPGDLSEERFNTFRTLIADKECREEFLSLSEENQKCLAALYFFFCEKEENLGRFMLNANSYLIGLHSSDQLLDLLFRLFPDLKEKAKNTVTRAKISLVLND